MVALDGANLTIEDVVAVARAHASVALDPESIAGMESSRQVVERIGKEGRVAYGIKTGIGQLANVSIPEEDIRRLQINIVRSHSAGVSDPLPEDVVRAMMVIRANGLAKGYSGVRPQLVSLICEMLNRGVHPVIPEKGSVGASGDLAPLAQMALAMMGEGEAMLNGERLSAAEALRRAGLEPLEFMAKEGLAIINGTSLMAAYGCLALHDARQLLKDAHIAGSLSFEALKASPRPFDPRIQQLRPHKGQIASARILLKLLQDSEIIPSHRDCPKVQDAYTLRCMPQVFGACLDVLSYAERVLTVEINSATDNPLVLPEQEEALSCGNFHGQPLAFILDFMAVAMTTLGGFIERRVARLLDSHLSELPPFLTKESGLNSGLMLAQYTAAALASENKVLAHPSSADSIPTSAGQEDFVCMGPAAGQKLQRVIRNVRYLVAIEYLCASQGLEFLKPLKPGSGARAAYEFVRSHVPPLEEDRPISPDTETIYRLVEAGEVIRAVEDAIGPLDFTT